MSTGAKVILAFIVIMAGLAAIVMLMHPEGITVDLTALPPIKEMLP